VAARLAPALARFADGVRQLVATLRDPDATVSRRAAAAWSLAGVPDAAQALREALAAPEPAVSANARAALAGGSPAPDKRVSAGVRLVTAAGHAVAAPVAHADERGPSARLVHDRSRGRASVQWPSDAEPAPTVSVPDVQ
jgi:hypothetical protein